MSAAHQAKVIAALRLPPPDGRQAWTTAALATELKLPRLSIQAAIDSLRASHKVRRGSIELHPSMIEAAPVAPPPPPPAPAPPPPARPSAASRPAPAPTRVERNVKHKVEAAMLEEPEDGFAFLRRRWPDLLARIVALGRGTGAGPANMMVAVVEAGLQVQERGK